MFLESPEILKPLLSALGVMLSGVFFYWYARKLTENELTIDGYLLADQSISGKEFSNTFASATLSLASVIIFFITSHREYGIWMAAGPMIYILVQFGLLKYISRLSLDLRQCRTVSDLWFKVFPSKKVARGISAITVFTSIMNVFVEVYIGSVIIAMYLPDTAFCRACAFFFIGLVIIGYVRYGGFKAIIKTDTLQLVLLILCAIAITLFAIYSPLVKTDITVTEITTRLFQCSETGWALIAFICWGSLINFCIGFTDMTVWQRMASTHTAEVAYSGLKRGLWKTLFTFWLPMMSVILIAVKGYHFDTMPEFLTIVDQQSGNLGYLLYPLIVIGFAAALFSSADSAMIAAMYGLCDQNTFLPQLMALPAEERNARLKRYLTNFSLVILALMTGLYYLEDSELGRWFMPIYYAVWGQIAVIAPLPIYALYRLMKGLPPITLTRFNTSILFCSLLAGWLAILLGSLGEAYLNAAVYSHIALFVGLAIVSVGVLLSGRRSTMPMPSASIQQPA